MKRSTDVSHIRFALSNDTSPQPSSRFTSAAGIIEISGIRIEQSILCLAEYLYLCHKFPSERRCLFSVDYRWNVAAEPLVLKVGQDVGVWKHDEAQFAKVMDDWYQFRRIGLCLEGKVELRLVVG